MRVSAQTKHATRKRILESAETLFRTTGYAATTTRQIAGRARIGIATLFNYFPTKEAIVSHLAASALKVALEKFERRSNKRTSLSEDLFALIACELRELRPCRTFLIPLLEVELSPPGKSRDHADVDSLRASHLEIAGRILATRGISDAQISTALKLYWNVYMGVLAHWVTDKSPHQEDTLALLNESLSMFAGWVKRSSRLAK